MLTLYELTSSLAGQVSVANTGDAIVKHLRRLIPFSLCVLYLYDVETDELEAKHVLGDTTSSIKGLRIALGQRLSGWVGANRQTIVNSDPVLDLGDVARGQHPRLRSCLSSPLIHESDLIGVLSLYSEATDNFSEDHKRIIEAVTRQSADALKRAAVSDVSTPVDSVTGLPFLDKIELLVGYVAERGVTFSSDRTLLFLDVLTVKPLGDKYGRSAADESMRHVVRHARSILRAGDVLFRSGNDELVALLNSTDQDTANGIGLRIAEKVSEHQIVLRGANPITVNVTFSSMRVPADWQSLRGSLAAARAQHSTVPRSGQASSIH
jgi:diguanylate cyclase (GGDEF)-like protein